MLGGRFENAAHGAICAALLPFVFVKNAECLQKIAAADGTQKLDALVRLLGALVERLALRYFFIHVVHRSGWRVFKKYPA